MSSLRLGECLKRDTNANIKICKHDLACYIKNLLPFWQQAAKIVVVDTIIIKWENIVGMGRRHTHDFKVLGPIPHTANFFT